MRPVNAISKALADAGVKVRKAQAAVVGETDVQWTRYLNGHRSPMCAKVQRWLVVAKGAGYPMVLEWSADGVAVASPATSPAGPAPSADDLEHGPWCGRAGP